MPVVRGRCCPMIMATPAESRRKPKSFYKKSFNKNKRDGAPGKILSSGMRGFLLTCNNKEKECVREAYNILNEYADQMYGPEQHVSAEGCDKDSGDEDEDIEAAMKKEVNDMKAVSRCERRFQNVNSGAKNCVFIKTSLDNPHTVVHSILQTVVDGKGSKARFICRLLPVNDSCPARLESILKTVENVYDSFCASTGCHEYCFSVMPKIRNQNTLSSNVLKCDISQMLKEKNCLNTVNYSNPEIVILLEVIRNVCCVSVVKDFMKFRKYNLSELQLHGYADTSEERKQEVIDMPKDVDKVCDIGDNGKCDYQDRKRKLSDGDDVSLSLKTVKSE